MLNENLISVLNEDKEISSEIVFKVACERWGCFIFRVQPEVMEKQSDKDGSEVGQWPP